MSRDLLHKKDLESFKIWCEKYGVSTRDGKGPYQLLQIKVHSEWHAIYERLDTHAGNELVHLTVPDKIMPLVKSFISDKKNRP